MPAAGSKPKILLVVGPTAVGKTECAVRLAEAGKFDHMVALDGIDMKAVPLAEAIKERKKVPVDCDKILTAREIGICMGN